MQASKQSQYRDMYRFGNQCSVFDTSIAYFARIISEIVHILLEMKSAKGRGKSYHYVHSWYLSEFWTRIFLFHSPMRHQIVE